MRKWISLMAVVTLSNTTSLQVSACSDNSQYQKFLSYVNNNETFIGFLGSAQCSNCERLSTAISQMQNPSNKSENSWWENFLNDKTTKVQQKSKGISEIKIHPFQSPTYAEGSEGDITNTFWNDTTINWQNNIFHWLLDHQSDNGFKIPSISKVNALKEDKSKNDDNSLKNNRFSELPIIFIVSNKKLVTAGQGWFEKESPIEMSQNAIKQLILQNLLNPS